MDHYSLMGHTGYESVCITLVLGHFD